jgi:predicted DCC family thiol-disulfide oxidoreductase YuxK
MAQNNTTSNFENLVLFDGICSFCNQSVRFLIRYDKDDKLKFASLQSSVGQQILLKSKLNVTTFTSILYCREGKVYEASDAVLYILRDLGYPLRLIFPFIFVPKALRDLVYYFISKHRYVILGKEQVSCQIPNQNVRVKIIDK